jgi:hypothetical protein
MYDELVARLWECASGECFNCSQYTETTNASVCSKELMKQAADAIENLICEVADEHNARLDAEERQRWVPVSDHLPEQQDEYLVLWSYKIGCTARLFYAIQEFDGENWIDDLPQAEPFGGAEVLYWMVLPERPKEG